LTNFSNGKQTQESLESDFSDTTFRKTNTAKRENTFMETKPNFSLTEKCFPLTNFSYGKQTQKSLESGFPETTFRETNMALVSLGILLQRSQHPYPDLDEQSFSIEWEFLYTFQLLTSILINQLELCQDSICIKQFLINGRQTQTASTRKIKNLCVRVRVRVQECVWTREHTACVREGGR
jgi:hypothetical protein